MICPKCNSECMEGAAFCIKCGASLNEVVQNNTLNTQNIQQPMNNFSAQPSVIQQPVNNVSLQPVNNSSVVGAAESLNYVKYIIYALLKPFKNFKENESKLNNPKNSIIFSLIVSAAMMLITLFKTIISVVFIKTMDYSTYKLKTSVEFSNLKELDYVKLIGRNFLIYAAIIVGIASIYYIISLIFKKNSNFIKQLSISATSVLPFIVLGMIVSPILGKIWAPLAIACVIIGFVYSIVIFVNLVNESITFDNVDMKIYFHAICMSIIGTAGYYIYIKLITSELTNSIGSFLDMLE